MYGDLPTICGGNWSSAVLALSTHGCRLARPLSWFVVCVVPASHSVPSMLIPILRHFLSGRLLFCYVCLGAVLFGRQSFPSCEVPGQPLILATHYALCDECVLGINLVFFSPFG